MKSLTKISIVTLAILTSTACARRYKGYYFRGNPAPQAPSGDPTNTFGSMDRDAAVDFMKSEHQNYERIIHFDSSQSSAASMTLDVGITPADGVPAQENDISLGSLFSLDGSILSLGCTISNSGDNSDSDQDTMPSNSSHSYNCSYHNSVNNHAWSWSATGSWSVKDANDHDQDSAVSFLINDYKYSGKYADNNDKEHSYSGLINGQIDYHHIGVVSSAHVRYERGYSSNSDAGASSTKSVNISDTAFTENGDNNEYRKSGMFQTSGLIKYEKNDHSLILKEEGRDLSNDSLLCNGDKFMTGSITYTDATDNKLVVTYKDCKRTASFNGQTIDDGSGNTGGTGSTGGTGGTGDTGDNGNTGGSGSNGGTGGSGGTGGTGGAGDSGSGDSLNLDLLACKAFSLTINLDKIVRSCKNTSIYDAGVIGSDNAQKMAFLKAKCEEEGTVTTPTQADAGHSCDIPEHDSGSVCLGAVEDLDLRHPKLALHSNVYHYDHDTLAQDKQDCEYPMITDLNGSSVRSPVKLGIFINL